MLTSNNNSQLLFQRQLADRGNDTAQHKRRGKKAVRQEHDQIVPDRGSQSAPLSIDGPRARELQGHLRRNVRESVRGGRRLSFGAGPEGRVVCAGVV